MCFYLELYAILTTLYVLYENQFKIETVRNGTNYSGYICNIDISLDIFIPIECPLFIIIILNL